MNYVLITGAASGLGKELTLMYMEMGYLVFALDIDHENLKKLPEKNIITCCLDVSKETEWEKNVIPVIKQHTNQLNIAIACAGIMQVGNVEECSSEDWKLMADANLNTHFMTAKKVIPFLKKCAGNILFIGSPSAQLAVRDEVGYVTFKHATVGLMKSIAFDYGKYKIRSNIIHPGWMRTAMSDMEMEEIMTKENVSLDKAYEIVCQHVPLKRPATLEEVCESIKFITSKRAGYITGAELKVDGGITIVDPGMIAMM